MTTQTPVICLNVLLVSDCADQGEVLTQAFNRSDYLDVGSVLSIDEATRLGESANGMCPEIIVLDLPESAWESVIHFLHVFKSHPWLCGRPLVMLVDDVSHAEMVPEGIWCSAIRKPGDADQLARLAFDFGEYWGAAANVPSPDAFQGDSTVLIPPVSGLPPIPSDLLTDSVRPVEIWVVDDNNDDATLFQESLVDVGPIRITRISDDPDETLAMLRGEAGTQRLPDLLVFDLHMPRKTGLKLLAELKADSTLRSFPVVIFSASRYERDVWESYRHGACAFLQKPPRFEWFQDMAVRFGNYWTRHVIFPNAPR